MVDVILKTMCKDKRFAVLTNPIKAIFG